MRYHQPYGVVDANASYINGDPSQGRPGSIPDAGSIEFDQREIVNTIAYSGFTPSDNDMMQLAKSIRSQRLNFVEDVGAVNAMAVVMNPTLQEYTVGLPLRVRVAHTTTGTTGATLDAGPGPKPIKRADLSVLQAGDLKAGQVVDLTFDGTNWQITNFTGIGGAGGTGDITTYNVKIPFAVDTGVVNAIKGIFAPAITVLNDGDAFLVRLSNAPTDVTTMQVNALAPHPVTTRDGAPIGPNLISVGEDLLMIWNSAAATFMLIGVSQAAKTARFTNIAVFNTPQTATWTVPAGIYQIYYQLWGAGGGGGGANNYTGGGPGGGGGHCSGYLTVTPGQQLNVVIGAGGYAVGAGNPSNGGVGGSSAFAGVATAYGGVGGTGGNGYVASSSGGPGGATGGQWSTQGASGNANSAPYGNYPQGGMGWGGAMGGQNFGQYPIVNASGGSTGHAIYNSQAGGPGLLLIHY